MPEFNVDIYKYHSDLHHMSNHQLRQHFHDYGNKECRIYDIDSIHFNWRFYIQHHHDLRPAGISTKESAISHFVNFGCKEFRKLHRDDLLYPSFTKSRICIFYAYYERLFDRKNQTNLMFFIRQTIHRSWPVNPESLTFVFLMNGDINCSVHIPDQDNVLLCRLDHVTSDFHAWQLGIQKIKEKYDCPDIHRLFDYFVFINCSCFGPVLDETNEEHLQHWLLPFHSRLLRDEAAACSPCISYLEPGMPEGSGPRLVSTFIFVRWTQHIESLLLDTPISSIDESSNNCHHFPDIKNTVLGHKHDKTDAILTGEYGFSRILLQYGYRLTCLLYDDIRNFDDSSLYKLNDSRAPDRFHTFFGQNIPFSKTIFIKNIWRCDGHSLYASLPVHYHECISYMNRICDFTPIFENITNVVWEYDALHDSKKEGVHAWETQFSWKNKRDYYRLYGESEETIIFPKQTTEKNRVAFFYASNYCSSVRSYLIEMVQTLLFVGYDIILSIPTEFHDIFLRHPSIQIVPCIMSCSDFWQCCQQKNQHYTFQLHLTDQIIFPIHGIIQMIAQLESLHSTNTNWKYSNDLFEILGDPPNSFVQITWETFFASPMTRHIQNQENGYEKYLKRFVS